MAPLNEIEKLVFVYNALSGKKNAILDSMHKVLSPSTYECNLCDITFGLFNEKSVWKEFRTAFPLEMEFLHKDEFEEEYASKFGYKYSYPIVLAAVATEFQVLISTEELDQLTETIQLIEIIKERVIIA